MNATRFALPPLPQPTYSFASIPRASYPDLKDSTIEYVSDREDFQRCMAEMVLVCKEAVRRQRRGQQRHQQKEQEPADAKTMKSKTKKNNPTTTVNGSKPLSLEYFADRLDVDEPLWGYVVRHQGRMQGFVCVTTFTNYERSFRWDSLNEAAFSDDDPDERELRITGERLVDDRFGPTGGALARQLQSTVRMGNVWDEGIVWPRIAEISLLGGLGCGRLLMELVLEDLERMEASSRINYDHVVLQATDNSISFYETLGFVRVGAITERDDNGESTTTKGRRPEPKQQSATTAQDALALPDNIVVSKVNYYKVAKAGEYLSAVAKKFKADVYDIIFLNEINYPDLLPGSRLIKGTLLRIPDYSHDSLQSTQKSSTMECSSDGPEEIKWHVAKENDTPRTIAKMYRLDSDAIVLANKNRLKGLLLNSRLKQGTRVRISHLDAPDIAYVPYAHWSFPDDDHFEAGEPSYMMAMTLSKRRQRGGGGGGGSVAVKQKKVSRPVRERLAVEIGIYQPTPLVVQVPQHSVLPSSSSNDSSRLEAVTTITGYGLFEKHYRATNSKRFKTKKKSQSARKDDAIITEEAWRSLPLIEKVKFVQQSRNLRSDNLKFASIYNTPQASPSVSSYSSSNSSRTQAQVDSEENLFNMVVRIDSSRLDEIVDVDPREYKYWYVVTFIPDLRWCHLAPMIQDGVFGPEKGKSEGRPKWKLVDEDLGKELDISSSFCVPCKSKAMKRTLDADKEEWDVLSDTLLTADSRGGGSSTSSVKTSTLRGAVRWEPRQPATISEELNVMSTTIAEISTKGSRKRKRSLEDNGDIGTTNLRGRLVATLLESGDDVIVNLKGVDGDNYQDKSRVDTGTQTRNENLVPLSPKKQQQQQTAKKKTINKKKSEHRKNVSLSGSSKPFEQAAVSTTPSKLQPSPCLVEDPSISPLHHLEQRVIELTNLNTCCLFVGDH